MNHSGHRRSQRPRKRSAEWAEKGTHPHHHPQLLHVEKLNRRTQMRLRYYELKIQLSDFCERIAGSVHSTLIKKTGFLVNQNGSPKKIHKHSRRSKTTKKYRSASLSPKMTRTRSRTRDLIHGKKFYSDREAIRAPPQVKESIERLGRRNSLISYRRKYSFTESKESKSRNRRKRSSLTKRKSYILDDDAHLSNNIISKSKKRMGIGDNSATIAHRDDQKSSSELRIRKANKASQKAHTNVLRKRQKHSKVIVSASSSSSDFSYSIPSAHDDTTDSDVKSTSKNDPKKAVKSDKAEEATKEEIKDGDSNPAPKELPPTPLSQHQQFALQFAGQEALNSKGLWKRLGLILLSNRKRRRDVNKLPPKLVRIGFQLSPPGEQIRKRGNPLMQLDHAFSHDTPLKGILRPFKHFFLDTTSKTTETATNNINSYHHAPKNPTSFQNHAGTLISNVMGPATKPVITASTPDNSNDFSIAARFRAHLDRRSTAQTNNAYTATINVRNPTTQRYQMDSHSLTIINSPENVASTNDNYNYDKKNPISILPSPVTLPLVVSPLALSNTSTNDDGDYAESISSPHSITKAIGHSSGNHLKGYYCPQTAFTAQFRHLLASN